MLHGALRCCYRNCGSHRGSTCKNLCLTRWGCSLGSFRCCCWYGLGVVMIGLEIVFVSFSMASGPALPSTVR